MQSARIERLRPFFARDGGDAAADDLRRHAVLLVALHAGNRPGQRRIGGGAGFVLAPCGGKSGFDIAGQQGADVDGERPQLVLQRHRHGRDGRLGRRIERLERDRDRTCDRTDAEDHAHAPLAHMRDDGTDAVERAEQVDVELAARLPVPGKLDRTGNAETGVVHEQVDPPL